jgi:hypothetical protein
MIHRFPATGMRVGGTRTFHAPIFRPSSRRPILFYVYYSNGPVADKPTRGALCRVLSHVSGSVSGRGRFWLPADGPQTAGGRPLAEGRAPCRRIAPGTLRAS